MVYDIPRFKDLTIFDIIIYRQRIFEFRIDLTVFNKENLVYHMCEIFSTMIGLLKYLRYHLKKSKQMSG